MDTVLAMIDLSAAFDTVDSDMLPMRLGSSYGLAGSVREWIFAFLGDEDELCRCMVIVGRPRFSCNMVYHVV
jgi:hypothetical protein